MKKIFTFIAAVCFAGSMMAANVLEVDFTQGQGEWTIDVKSNPDNLDAIWTQTSSYGMKATAYTSSDKVNHESEAWLISPAIDLSAVESATLAIAHARKFGDLSQLAVKASADGETWTALELSAWPDGSSWDFVDATADMAAFVGKNAVRIAFVYTSSSTAAATWEIKTLAIGEGGVTPPAEKIDTISVADAVAIAEALAEPESGKSTYSNKEVVVAGFAVSVYDKNDDGSWSFYMADEADAKGDFMASNAAADADVVKGDFIFLRGKICKYKAKSSGNIILQIYKGTATHGEAPQGIENVALTENAQKLVVDGVLYIIRDNKMYNVQGLQVR